MCVFIWKSELPREGGTDLTPYEGQGWAWRNQKPGVSWARTKTLGHPCCLVGNIVVRMWTGILQEADLAGNCFIATLQLWLQVTLFQLKKKKKTVSKYLHGQGDTMTSIPGQGEAHPLPSRCTDPWILPKCGKLNCMICGSGALHLCSPLQK